MKKVNDKYEYLDIPDYLMPSPRTNWRLPLLWWPTAMIKYSVLPYIYQLGAIRGCSVYNLRA